MYDLKMNTISVKYVTDFQWFVISMIFWTDTYAPQDEFIIVNGQTATSAFHKVA